MTKIFKILIYTFFQDFLLYFNSKNYNIYILGDISNEREKLNLANKMKMVTYLMCQLMELIEADVLQKESANVANKKQRKKNNAMDDESWNWEGRRLDAITLMYRLLSLNINALFDPPIVEGEMINLRA